MIVWKCGAVRVSDILSCSKTLTEQCVFSCREDFMFDFKLVFFQFVIEGHFFVFPLNTVCPELLFSGGPHVTLSRSIRCEYDLMPVGGKVSFHACVHAHEAEFGYNAVIVLKTPDKVF